LFKWRQRLDIGGEILPLVNRIAEVGYYSPMSNGANKAHQSFRLAHVAPLNRFNDDHQDLMKTVFHPLLFDPARQLRPYAREHGLVQFRDRIGIAGLYFMHDI
jgi:hypothetical protein